MKKILLVALSASFCLLSFARKKDKAKQVRPNVSVNAKPTFSKGLFNVEKKGDDYYFEIPDSLIGRQFLATVRLTYAPAGVGKYSGELVNSQTVYFQKLTKKRLLLRSSIIVSVADSTQAINRAVRESNENPIIGSFNIESHSKGMNKIKVSNFFMSDNPALGANSMIKKRFGLTAVLPQLSYIESIKTFPMNTEVRTVKTCLSVVPQSPAARATGKVTVGFDVSFVLLPKVPMRRRLFDPRIGYFTDDFTYFSDYQQQVKEKRFITRWRMEPKDSVDAEKMKRGELVEPKKPIIFYIDPATPKKWVPYLIQGVNDWQKAFEKAGFKNAIMAKEWPNDSTMSLDDARYNCILYLASPIENAYGPQIHDPRSGEIIESHICWYHNVMKLIHDWYMIQAGNLDEAARKMKFDTKLMGQLIRFVSSHEVGHTLGLRHNFGSSSTVPVDSLRNKEWVEKHGHTPSIMDYARFNYVAQPEDSISRKGIFPRINDYDIWAIQWGYTPMWNAYDDESDHWEEEKLTRKMLKNKRLWFGDGETNDVNDPRCQTEDLGDDAIKAGLYGIMNLKRMLPKLPKWTYQSNDMYQNNLKSLYSGSITQFFLYMMHVARNIGGIYKDYHTIDEGGTTYTDVTKKRQKECLDFLNNQVITEPTWLISPDYVKNIKQNPSAIINKVGVNIVDYLTREIYSLNKSYPVQQYLPDLKSMIFSELKTGQSVSDYKKALQDEFVNKLLLYSKISFNSENVNIYPTVLNVLQTLRKELATAKADSSTKAHYNAITYKIEKALEIRK